MCRENLKLTTILTCFLAVLFAFVNPAQSQPAWDFANPYPVAGDITQIDQINEDVCFLRTDASLMMRTEDGGLSWSQIPLPEDESTAKIFDFYDESSGWIIGARVPDRPWEQPVYHTQNTGRDWTRTVIGTQEFPSELTCIYVIAPDLVAFAGMTRVEEQEVAAFFLLDLEAEETYSTVLPESAGTESHDLFFLNASMGWVVGQTGYTAYTFDGGERWERGEIETNLNLYSVHFSGPFHGWAAGGRFNIPGLFTTSDGGESWTVQEDLPVEFEFCEVRALSATSAVAVTRGSGQFNSRIIKTDNGRDWDVQLDLDDQYLLTASLSDEGGWSAGKDGLIYKCVNGQDWHLMTRSITSEDIQDVFFTDQRNGWACADNSTILSTENGGQSWTAEVFDINDDFQHIGFFDPDTGIVISLNGQEYITYNGGEAWEEIDVCVSRINVFEINGDFAVAESNDQIFISEDRGQNWENHHLLEDNNTVNDVSCPEPGVVLVSSFEDVLVYTLNGGGSWDFMLLPYELAYAVSFLNSTTGWVIGVSENEYKLAFTDGGQSWTELHSFNNRFVLDLCFVDRNIGFVQLNPSAIQMTTDGGRSWTELNLPTNEALIAIEPLGPENLWITGTGGMLAHWGSDRLDVGDEKRFVPVDPAFSCFPNPSNGTVTLTFSSIHTGLYNIKVFDITGRELPAMRQSAMLSGSGTAALNFDALASGSYWVQVSDRSQLYAQRVLIVK